MNKYIEIIQDYEDQALSLGDLKTAIKLNWLRNSCLQNNLTEDDLVYKLLEITVLNR